MEGSLFKLFEAAAGSYPHAIATIFDDGEAVSLMTYSFLRKSSLVVTELLKENGWQYCSVGLYCGTVSNFATVFLGILGAPCCFIPLDPQAPQHITTHVISTTKLGIVFVQVKHYQKFLMTVGKEYTVEVCNEDKLCVQGFVIVKLQVIGSNKKTTPVKLQPGLAYIMHTSGTTGTPKVIRVPHQCILPNILHLREAFNISKNDVIFNAAPMTFDTSIVEIFLALSQGASVLMVPTALKLMPRRLMDVLMRNHVTAIQATPTLIQRFDTSLLRSHLFSATSSLRLMIFGGEACPTPAMIYQWRSHGNRTQFYNIYGITEVSCWATLYQICEEDICSNNTQSVPLGDPLSETIIEVRDENGQAVSRGTGRVFIGGTSRTCYLGNEDISPSSSLKPVMRDTGDLAEITPQGLVYLGRSDDQIKRSGKRVTLTQIQQSAEMLSSISSCAAILDTQQLLLFCVPANIQITPIPQCIAPMDPFFLQLRNVLPSHGIPDKVYWVQALPLTLHGKLDRKSLLQIARSVNDTDEELEESRESGDIYGHILQLWQALLPPLPPDTTINNTSNFVILGGDSFQVVQMATQLETCYGTSLPHFVDKILHGSFKELVGYVEDTVLRSKTVKLDAHSGGERNTCKRLHTEAFSDEFESTMSTNNQYLPHKVESKAAVSDISGCENCSKNALSPCSSASCITSQDSSDVQCNDWCFNIRRGSNVTTASCQQRGPSIGLCDTAVRNGSVLQLKWRYNTGKCVDASPLLVQFRSEAILFIGSHSHRFSAISMETGIALWEIKLGDRIESSACLSTCGNFVIVGFYNGAVYILHSMTGLVYWKYKTEGSVKSSPVSDGESSLVYIGSHDQHLYALNIKDKDCSWRAHCGGGSLFSSPCVYYPTHTVYVGTLAGNLVAINKTNGELQWSYRCAKPIFSSPVASVTGVIVGCADGLLYCFSHTGDKLWSFKTEAPIFSSPSTPPTVCGHHSTQLVLFGSHDQHVYCLEQTTGNLVWRTKLPSQVYATPFIFHTKRGMDRITTEMHSAGCDKSMEKIERFSNTVTQSIRQDSLSCTDSVKDQSRTHQYEPSFENQEAENHYKSERQTDITNSTFVAVSCTSGHVAILDISDGDVLVTYELPGEVFSSPIVYKDHIIVGCRDDYVYCLDIS